MFNFAESINYEKYNAIVTPIIKNIFKIVTGSKNYYVNNAF